MLIEFKSVRSSMEEQWQKENVLEEPGFHNTKDYIAKIVIEMDDVVDFTGGRVYYNSNIKECVYPRFKDEFQTPTNLLVTADEFKRILEKTRNIRIQSAAELLNKTDYEGDTASI